MEKNVVMDDPLAVDGVRTYAENGSPKSVITAAYPDRRVCVFALPA